MSPDGRFLIAADTGSSEISVMWVNDDGSLRSVPGGVVRSGGLSPDSVAIHGDLVYVANEGYGASNYTGFRLTRSGRLVKIAHSDFKLPAGSSPGDVLFNGNGTMLAATRMGTSLIDIFRVRRDGRLTAATRSPFSSGGAGPCGSEFSPTNPGQLFVSNASRFGYAAGGVSAYRVSAAGRMSSIRYGQVGDSQTGTGWMQATPDGRFLFAVNYYSASISRYSIGPDGALTMVGNTRISAVRAIGVADERMSPDGRELFVNEVTAGAVAAFAVHGGKLTPMGKTGTPLPRGAAPTGIADS
jgi:6-phosphogluconolactonase (cycloisomerase 2 family)